MVQIKTKTQLKVVIQIQMHNKTTLHKQKTMQSYFVQFCKYATSTSEKKTCGYVKILSLEGLGKQNNLQTGIHM